MDATCKITCRFVYDNSGGFKVRTNVQDEYGYSKHKACTTLD